MVRVGGWVEGLFVACKEMNDIIGQHRRENASYSSKNWIAG